MMVAVVVLMVLAAPSAASESTTAELNLCHRTQQDYVSCAQREAQRFASYLGLTRPLRVKMTDTPPARSLTGRWAWSMRDTYSAGGCLLLFMPDSIIRSTTIAHEVCHCRYDYEIMTNDGAVRISPKEMARVEARAEECSEWLVDGGVSGRVDRMMRRVPEFGTSSREGTSVGGSGRAR